MIIEGYADEIGGAEYNQILSEKRALEVSTWSKDNGIMAKLLVHGMGQVPVDIDFSTLFSGSDGEMSGQVIYKSLPLVNKIRLNQDARRVDIKAITK